MAAQNASLGAVDPTGPGPSLQVVGAVASLSLFIAGKPEPKGRPRFARRGERVVTFTDDTTLTWEQSIGWQVKEGLLRLSMVDDGQSLNLPFSERVICVLRFNFDKPVSTPKKVRFPTKSRTDVDNLAKAVLDALQAVGVLRNDSIVTDLTACKRYSDPEHPQGVEIELIGWQ